MILGKSGAPVSGCRASARRCAAAARASSIWRGVVQRCARASTRPSSGKPSPPCPGAARRRASVSSRTGTGRRPTDRTRTTGPRVVALRRPRAAGFRAPASLGGARPDQARQPRDARVDQDAVDVDPAQAGAEAVVADDQHAGPRWSASSRAGRSRRRDPSGPPCRRGIPFGSIDAGLIDVQVMPDAMLERVEVLELDHQGRPVGDDLVGEQAAFGAAAEESRRSAGRSRSAPRAIAARASRSSGGCSRAPRPRAARRTRARPRAPRRDGGRPCPRRTTPRTSSGGNVAGTFRLTTDRPASESRCQNVGTRTRPEWLTFIRPAAGIVVAVVEDAVPRRAAAGHHARPGGRSSPAGRSSAACRAPSVPARRRGSASGRARASGRAPSRSRRRVPGSAERVAVVAMSGPRFASVPFR